MLRIFPKSANARFARKIRQRKESAECRQTTVGERHVVPNVASATMEITTVSQDTVQIADKPRRIF